MAIDRQAAEHNLMTSTVRSTLIKGSLFKSGFRNNTQNSLSSTYLHYTMSSNDVYTQKAEETSKISPQQKINDLSSILNTQKFAMCTSFRNTWCRNSWPDLKLVFSDNP